MKKRIIARITLLVMLFTLLCASASAVTYGKTPSDGLIPFKDDSKGKWGYMDYFHNVVIKPQFTSVNAFQNGLAVVQVSKNHFAVDQFIDVNGKVKIKNISNLKKDLYGYTAWMGDYAVVEGWDITTSRYNGTSISPRGYNYITAKGKLLSKTDFTYAGYFADGYALVGTGYVSGKGTRNSSNEANWITTKNGSATTSYYFIDMEGNQLGSSTWTLAKPFNEGMAAVAVKGAKGTYA